MRSSPPCHEQGHLPLDHVCYEVNRCTFWHLFLAQMSFKSKKVFMRVFTSQKQKFHLKKNTENMKSFRFVEDTWFQKNSLLHDFLICPEAAINGIIM